MVKKVLLFDLFHTLVRPTWAEEDTEYYALGIEGSRWSKASSEPDLYHERAIGLVKDPREIVARIALNAGLAPEPTMIDQLTNIRIKKFMDTLVDVEEDVIHTLIALKDRGYKLCLVSNADVIDILNWTASPLSLHFDDVIFSCDVGVAKPDRAIYDLALNRMDVNSNEAIFIGDGGSKELMGAKNVGIETIMTTEHTFEGQESLDKRAQYADRQISKIDELCEIL